VRLEKANEELRDQISSDNKIYNRRLDSMSKELSEVQAKLKEKNEIAELSSDLQ